MPKKFLTLGLPALLLACVVSTSLLADDWPQWMGPTRDGVYRETGIVDAIPEHGLPVKWRTPVRGGYGGPAVVGNRIFLMDYERTAGEMIETPGDRPQLSGIERVLAFDANTGEEVWSHQYDCNYEISFPAGPRVTPTVVDNLVVALGAEGDLNVLSADTGELKWHVNIPKQFGVKTPVWGFAAHPLVTKDKVITMVGGEGHAVVAFDREDGTVIWHSQSSSDAGYCPPSLVNAGGVEQLLIWHPEAVASLNPINGELYWSEALQPQGGMSIARPQREGDLLFVGGFKNTSLMLRLMAESPTVSVEWESEVKMSLSPATMTPLIHDGIIFGCDNELGALLAVRASDGERLWQSYLPIRPSNVRRLRSGTCFVTRHPPSGRYLLFGEMGQLMIASMNADEFRSHGQMQVLEPTQTGIGRKVIWSHPAYANKTAYIRNDNELVAVDLSLTE
ncbi:MAG: PQQ-binding-like beta-propeller repeat protein [Rubripirellula sp.]